MQSSRNLRSVVSQAVSRGSTSFVPRRNFGLTRSPTNETTEAGGKFVAAALSRSTERPRLSPVTYLMFGYSGFACWEMIRLLEYRRTCLRFAEEEDESQLKVPKGLW